MDVLDADLFYESEKQWRHPNLDLPYVLGVATDLAELLEDGAAEVAYQPGDGTFYGLVFLPLLNMAPARPRVVDGIEWETRAIRGMFRGDGKRAHFEDLEPLAYDPDGYLVAWVEHAVYPLSLARGRSDLAATYVAEKFNTTLTSAVSLAVLFRALAAKLPNRMKVEV